MWACSPSCLFPASFYSSSQGGNESLGRSINPSHYIQRSICTTLSPPIVIFSSALIALILTPFQVERHMFLPVTFPSLASSGPLAGCIIHSLFSRTLESVVAIWSLLDTAFWERAAQHRVQRCYLLSFVFFKQFTVSENLVCFPLLSLYNEQTGLGIFSVISYKPLPWSVFYCTFLPKKTLPASITAVLLDLNSVLYSDDVLQIFWHYSCWEAKDSLPPFFFPMQLLSQSTNNE